MAIKVGHATKNELGSSTGGAPGDSTGKEVCIIKWYDGGWHTVLRPKTAELAEKSAKACEDACANDNIGYDMAYKDRNTLNTEAKAVNYDLSKIKNPCEVDCSGLMHNCAIAGGANLSYGSNALNTRTMVDAFIASGDYEALTDEKYLTSDKYLMRGDILMKSGHTVMALENGEEVIRSMESVSLTMQVLKKGDKGEQVEALQRLLSTYGYKLGNKNPFDGSFGSMTKTAVQEFQKDRKLPSTGIVDADTWKELLGCK